jgi:hypothetical protein
MGMNNKICLLDLKVLIHAFAGFFILNFFVSLRGDSGVSILTVRDGPREDVLIVACVACLLVGILPLRVRGGHGIVKDVYIMISAEFHQDDMSLSYNKKELGLPRTFWGLGARFRSRRLADSRLDKPFGGVTLLIGGDFQQTLPVIPKGSREQILDATVTRSYLWNDIEVIHLHQNMRLRDDPDAEQWNGMLY